MRELVEQIAKSLVDHPDKVSVNAVEGEQVTVRRLVGTYSSARAVRELGYPQTPLRQTLEKTYRWYVENGHLPKSPG